MDNPRLLQTLTFCDKILIALILVIAIGMYGVLALKMGKISDDIVIVQQNGIVVLQLTQDELGEDDIYDFEFDGGIGYIEVKENKVRMLKMDKSICPDAICSNTGWIESNAKTIVCMPNKLIVSFARDATNQIDGTSY